MRTLVLAIGSLVLLAGGCATNSAGSGSAFDSAGIPRARYYIGGGADIEYIARYAGTLYIIEANTKTFVIMKAMNETERFEVTIDVRDGKTHMSLKSLGIDPLNCNFAVYFIPVE